ncbi:MAG: penicillin-binding transpeptidase domain-containing protein, partial [Alistipes sp.]|nr:penicillin-binding transpeptidase domain-containing protein [Alistipes sp.]
MYQEIKDYILAMLRSRILPLATLFIVMIIILIQRLFELQIIQGEDYLSSISSDIETTRSIASTRGNIYDCNGVLLAYNDLAFSVKISDSGKYETLEAKNTIINDVIVSTIRILQKHHEKISCDYSIVVNEDGKYDFNVSSENARLRFLRDSYGVKTISDLSNEQVQSTALDVVEFLAGEKFYGIDLEKYPPEMVVYILNFRSYMSANSYQRYMEFTMSYDVNDETVAEILENSGSLIGVSVSEEYIRKYVDGFYAAHILGYTGKISTDELETLSAQNNQYAANDMVGKSGIEQSMELYLQGTKGSRTVYTDRVGRITEIISQTEPVTGCDVYLTIDIELQKKVYKALEQQIAEILVGKITTGDEQYTYKSDGTTIDDILIPIKNVYNALIENNVISVNEIAGQKTSTETSVYAKFLSKQDEVLNRVYNELMDNDTHYQYLSEEMQVYIYTIYQNLVADGIILSANVDKLDSVYEEWVAETISLKEYLSYALAKNWIDVSKFTNAEYSSLSEAYNSLVKYIIEDCKNDTEFTKKIYRFMIRYSQLSGSEICVLLYDQGVLPYDNDSYGRLIMGTLKPYDFLVNKIRRCEITPAQLALRPCSGSTTIIDTHTGRILALVSYPSYDINMLSGTVDANYYYRLLNDGSKPLINNATTTKNAPGSAYKIVTAIAGLETGVVDTVEEMECNGIYETVTPNPKCWVYPGRHGDENIATALRDSCNVFFYEVGYRLATNNGTNKYDSNRGTDILADYARQLGLATTTGIEIYEATPTASNDNAVSSAIGQGRNNFTGLNLARYASTIANNGVCYDLTLIDKIVDSSGNNVFVSIPIVTSTMNDVSDSTWNTVHLGMRLVSESSSYMTSIGMETGSKSGTAQEKTTYPDHCTYIAYAPFNDPEIAVSTVIQNGY